MSKSDWTEGRGFSESKNKKAKHKKTNKLNATEKQHGIIYLQTKDTGRYKFVLLVALLLTNTLALGYITLGSSRRVRAYYYYYCMPYSSPDFLCSDRSIDLLIYFAMKRSHPYFAVLRHSPSSWATAVYFTHI